MAQISVDAGTPEPPAGRAPGEARDVVFTFHRETWDDAWRRELSMASDRLLHTLLLSSLARRLVVADPYRSVPVRRARQLLRPASRAPFDGDPDRSLVEPGSLRRHDPASIRGLERRYRAYDRTLERAATRLGAECPIVITTSPFVAGFAPLHWAAGVTYCCWDDWPPAPRSRRWRPAYEAAYARIRASARTVVAGSQAILDRIGPAGPSAVVPHGVVPAEWRSPGPAPRWFATLPAPRILYRGVIDDRLDLAAVSAIADRFPGGTVVLLGPVSRRASPGPLRGRPNVRLAAPAGRDEVPAVVHAADVCVMPLVRNPLTATTSPRELYEHLAAGRPVVATDLPPVAAVDPRIVRVRPGDSFADGVAWALGRGPLAEGERLAFIDAHSWSRRHDEILALAFDAPPGG